MKVGEGLWLAVKEQDGRDAGAGGGAQNREQLWQVAPHSLDTRP